MAAAAVVLVLAPGSGNRATSVAVSVCLSVSVDVPVATIDQCRRCGSNVVTSRRLGSNWVQESVCIKKSVSSLCSSVR